MSVPGLPVNIAYDGASLIVTLFDRNYSIGVPDRTNIDQWLAMLNNGQPVQLGPDLVASVKNGIVALVPTKLPAAQQVLGGSMVSGLLGQSGVAQLPLDQFKAQLEAAKAKLPTTQPQPPQA